MKYSIIIPVHNAEKTIERCVNSIILQRGFDIQILLIENGSSDNSKKLCEFLASNYETVELYVSDKIGVSNARNIGLSNAIGDIIGFCDADDYYLEDSIRTVDEIFENNNVDVVYTGLYIDNGSMRIKRSIDKNSVISSHRAIEYVLNNNNVMGSVWNKFFRRSIIGNTRFSNTLTHMEDGCFNIEVLSKKRDAKIMVSTQPTYCYIDSKESATGNLDNAFSKEDHFLYYNAMDYMLENIDLTKTEKAFIKDSRYRLGVENIMLPQVLCSDRRYNDLYDEIKENFFPALFQVFKFDKKSKIKLIVKGLKVIIGGRRNEKSIVSNSSGG